MPPRSHSKEKTPGRQNGFVHLTTHRLLYVDTARPSTNSFALSLSHIRQSEYYAGFLSSSPKVTLCLKEHEVSRSLDDEESPPSSSDEMLVANDEVLGPSWICSVCSYSNPATADDDMRPRCALCGVPRDPLAYAASKRPQTSVYRSPSMPTLRHPAPITATGTSPPPDGPTSSAHIDIDLNACPACTYLNHHSMKYCEICGTPLPVKSPAGYRVPPSRSSGSTPMPASVHLPSTVTLRVSFRKGGDKAFYSHLKKVLQAKVWGDVSIHRRNIHS
jgi:ESCRT-II complex subunit VPS36